MTLRHIIIDIETLATDPNAVVLSIACVPFVLENHTYFSELVKTGFCVKFNAKEQINTFNRTVEESTIKWWKTQPKEVFDAMVRPSSKDVDLIKGLTLLNKFISNINGYSFKESYVWSRGNNFDFPILKSLYQDSGILPAYNEWKIRDVRTAIDIMAGTNTGTYQLKCGGDGFIAHNPLQDAAMDAARLNELFYIMTQDGNLPF